MDFRCDDPQALRTLNGLMLELVTRYMRNAAQVFGDDYDAAIIFLAVAEANGRASRHDVSLNERIPDLGAPLPPEDVRPMSRQAIAESLGLPRETVRRKIAALVAQGFLEEDPRGGVILVRGVAANAVFVAAQTRVLGYVRQFQSDLEKYLGRRDK